MPRLTPDKWQDARAEYEAGASQSAVAVKYGTSRMAIQKRIAKEGWTQDLEPAIRRKMAEKVAGAVAGGDPAKNAAAMDAEAERRAEVIRKHRTEWDAVRAIAYKVSNMIKDAGDGPINPKAAMLLKIASGMSEAFSKIQAGERKAWGLDEKQDPAVTLIANLFQGRIDVKALTIEELKESRGLLT